MDDVLIPGKDGAVVCRQPRCLGLWQYLSLCYCQTWRGVWHQRLAMDLHVWVQTICRERSLNTFSIEGALTIGVAILGYFIVLNFPDSILASGKKGSFTQNELEVVLDRVERDRGDSLPDKLTWEKFWKHIGSWQLWIYGFMFLCCSAPIYSFAFVNPTMSHSSWRNHSWLALRYFIQTILKTMGYTTAVVFLLVARSYVSTLHITRTNCYLQCAPPYLFSAIWTVAVAWMADRTKMRMPYMVLNAIITLTGLLLTAYCKVINLIQRKYEE